MRAAQLLRVHLSAGLISVTVVTERGSHEEDTPSFHMGGAKILGDLRYALRHHLLVCRLLLCKSVNRPAVDQLFDWWGHNGL